MIRNMIGLQIKRERLLLARDCNFLPIFFFEKIYNYTN